MMRGAVIDAAYLAAATLFILGILRLVHPGQARRGLRLAAAGMFLAAAGTLFDPRIVDFRLIAVGLLIGVIVGYLLGAPAPAPGPAGAAPGLTPRIPLSLSLSSLAIALVGVAEYHRAVASGRFIARPEMAAIGFAVLLGTMSTAGSLVIARRLREPVGAEPDGRHGLELLAVSLGAFTVGMLAYLIIYPPTPWVFYTMVGLALVFGVLLMHPVPGADAPAAAALLAAVTGLAACAAGFALDNTVLLVAGMLVASAAFSLSIRMSRSTGGSIGDVLFSAFRTTAPAAPRQREGSRSVTAVSVDDAALQLAYARRVIVVPGYGMAVARAHHALHELTALLEARGTEVKYAVHPVAGRMPGHMNVLLAEAGVPYDRVYDLDEINGEFEEADVALLVGANDIVNPAARSVVQSPIHGMPILDVDRAGVVIALKRGMAPGFAGIENRLFVDERARLLFGDARTSLVGIVAAIRSM